jgi:tetratricopeptide (TPR) repeat protein
LAWSALSTLFRFGVPLGAAGIIGTILLNVDYALVGHLLGAVQLGIYVLAFNAASLPSSLLLNLINNVSMPAFSRVKHDADLLKDAITGGLRALCLAVLPISALMIALARPIVLILYGPKWTASTNVLMVLSVYGAISIICILFANIIASVGRAGLLLIIQLVWFIALIPAMIIGVHYDGVVGAAIAHIVVIGPFILPIYILALKRTTGIRVRAVVRVILPALLAASAAALGARVVASQFVNPLTQLVTGLMAGGLIYLVAAAPQVLALLNQENITVLRAGNILRLLLALAQSGAVIAGQQLGYGTFLGPLRTRIEEGYRIRAEGPSRLNGAPQAVPLSKQVVRAHDPAGVGAGVMETLAVLSAAGVRPELLRAAGQAGVLARRRRRSRVSVALVDQACQSLVDRRLLTLSMDGQKVVAHRLVMRVVRDGLAREGRLVAVCRGIASVLDSRARALADSPDRAAVRDLPEQVLALLYHVAGPAAQADDELARITLSLRFWALYYLNELGDSASRAIAVGEPLVRDFDQLLGPGDPETLSSRNSLALAYLRAGRAADAILQFGQILDAQERLLGPDHPATLASQNNIATAYRQAGRIAEAISLFELTLAARERVLGLDHPDALSSRDSLAAAYREAGRVGEAIPLFELTLTAREYALGVDHPRTLNTRNNLALAYQEAGRAAEAIPLFEQTLADRERVLGADHLDTLTTRDNLAGAYLQAGWGA